MANTKNQNNRPLIIGAAAVVTVVIAAVIGWILLNQTEPTPVSTPVNQQPGDVVTVNASITNAAPPAAPVVTETEVTLIQLAQLFAERYGSYTTDSHFENVTNLKPYMTSAMQQSADDFVRVQQARSANAAYTAVVTKVISTAVDQLHDANATVRVTTQRDQSGDAFDTNNVYYQDVVLQMVLQDDAWLVDSASWQAEGEPTTSTNASESGSEEPVDLEELLNSLGV